MATRNEILSVLKEILNYYSYVDETKYQKIKRVAQKSPDFTVLRQFTTKRVGFFDAIKLLFRIGDGKAQFKKYVAQIKDFIQDETVNYETKETLIKVLEIVNE